MFSSSTTMGKIVLAQTKQYLGEYVNTNKQRGTFPFNKTCGPLNLSDLIINVIVVFKYGFILRITLFRTIIKK